MFTHIPVLKIKAFYPNCCKINTKGSSLLQVLISMFVISVIAGSIATRISSQKKDIIKLKEKYIKKDLDYLISDKLNIKKYCDCLFKNLKIENNIINMSNNFLMPASFDNTCNSISKEGEDIVVGSNYDQSQIRIKNISIEDLTPNTVDTFKARLIIKLQNDDNETQLAPIVKDLLIKEEAYDSVLNKKPLSCVYGNKGQGSNSRCGSGTRGSRQNDRNPLLCFGHNPRYSCPHGYYQAFYREMDYVYFYTCIKN